MRVNSPPVVARRYPTADTTLGELSARNRLRGFVEEVRVDGLLAQVRLRVGDQRLTAVITADAIAALKLRRGDDAIAIIKSTEVMIARPGESGGKPKGRRTRERAVRYRADICARKCVMKSLRFGSRHTPTGRPASLSTRV